MGIYEGFEYGVGIVYGGSFQFISPASGPITGGTEVVITGESYLDTDCNDDFDDGIINPALWSPSKTGDASSIEESNGKIHLQVSPIAGSSAVLTGLNLVGDTDIEVGFSIVSQLLALPPTGDVEMATLQLYVDVSNYAQISRKAGGNSGHRYEAVVVVGGVTIESGLLSTPDLSGSLRIIRNGDTVYLYAGTTEVLRRTGFVTTDAAPIIVVNNLAEPYAIVTDFDNFVIHTMVVFGTEPVRDAFVPTNDRIFGTSPVGIEIASVPIYIATCTGTVSVGISFEYVDPALFNILAKQELVVAISNDTTLRNLVPGRYGFMR